MFQKFTVTVVYTRVTENKNLYFCSNTEKKHSTLIMHAHQTLLTASAQKLANAHPWLSYEGDLPNFWLIRPLLSAVQAIHHQQHSKAYLTSDLGEV